MVLASLLLEAAAGGRWRPGIGDPSWTGWLTVAAYAFAASLALLVYRSCRSDAGWLDRTHPHHARNERRLAGFWLLAVATLIALGTNKQLDLQSLFTQLLRDAAHAQGWYDDRRRYQLHFVLGIAAAGLVGVGSMAWMLRRVLDRVWMAVLGLGWMASFVVIRAASFHHVDTFLQSVTQVGTTTLELSGIAMVAAGAGRALRSRPAALRERPDDHARRRVAISSSAPAAASDDRR